MADEKTLTINANFTESYDLKDLEIPSMEKAEALAERNALLETRIADTYGDEGTPEDFAKKKGKAGRPKKGPIDEELDETKKRFAGLNAVLDNTQKVVIALNGVNGRVTKAMAVFNRSLKYVVQGLDDYDKAQKKAEAAAGGGGGDGPEDKVEAVTDASDEAASALAELVGKVGIAAAAFTALSAITFLAGKLLSRLIDNLKEVVGEFSAALLMAEAKTEISELENQQRASQQVGGELAVLEDANRELKAELSDFKAAMIDLISGPLTLLVQLVTKMLEFLTGIMNILNSFFEFIGQALGMMADIVIWLATLGQIVKPITRWLTSDEVAKANKDGGLASALDDLGDLSFFRKGSKGFDAPGLKKRGFLPGDPFGGGKGGGNGASGGW